MSKFSVDFLLHKLANKGLDKILEYVKQINNSQAPAFKPVKLEKLLRPHLIWYMRRHEKRIIELGLIGSLVVTVIILLIKNWR